MKNKILRNISFGIICFFFTIMTVEAASVGSIGELKYGDEITLITYDFDHRNPSCSVIEGNINSSPYSLVQVPPGEPKSGVTKYIVKFDKNVTSDGQIVIECTYTEPTNLDERKSGPYYFKYSVSEISATGDYHGYLDNVYNKSINLKNELEIDRVESISLDDSDGIIISRCSGIECDLILNSGYESLSSRTIRGTIKYKKTVNIDGVDRQLSYTTNLRITVDVKTSATVSLTSYGSCALSSDWVRVGKSNRYETTKVGSMTMPDCVPSENSQYPMIEFKGWIGVNKTDSGAQKLNVCAQGDYTLLRETFNIEPGYTYYPCYANAQGIVIYAAGAKVDIDDSWKRYTSTNSWYKQSNNNITLPTATLTGNTEGKSIQGWYNQRTKKIYDMGASVEPNGDIYILKTQTERTYRNYYKSIYVGEPYKITQSDGKITDCRPANTSYIQNKGSGECILVGQMVSEDYIDVLATGDNGYERTFHVRVVSRNDRSEAGDKAFEIDVTPNIIASVTDKGTLNTYFIDKCEHFYMESEDYSGTDNSGANILKYDFVPKDCAYGGGDYITYCIDAGRISPPGGEDFIYNRKETIDPNSDFGKLITYMGNRGWFDDAHVETVTTLVRIVGIIDNITIASQYNSSDVSHMASYEVYASIANQIVGEDGKIDPSKVDGIGGVNGDVKTALKEYQNVETREELSFERTVDHIDYGEGVKADGSYTVVFEGTMTIPGDSASLSGFSKNGITGTVNEFKPTEKEELKSSGATIYDYKVTIEGNVNAELPKSMGKLNGDSKVTEEAKEFCFKLTVTSGGTSKDAFLMEPTGTAASDGYQRMLTINRANPTLYVYFPIAPSSKECFNEGVSALNPASGSLNVSMFRSAGCCNSAQASALSSDDYDAICSNSCISSTLDQVCDYRESFDFISPTADMYEVHEGIIIKSDGSKDYRIGSGGITECIVKTDNVGYEEGDANGGMQLKADSSVTKYDDAGNSLMVADYENNRYCRVSCSEDWQLSMESFGNFIGQKAVAAGSYFQITDSDLFIGGKRTCYTTYIIYGNTNVSPAQGEVDGSHSYDQGFTRDLAIESDIIIESYDKYSNLAHFYTDLLCTNDDSYVTEAGTKITCDYSDIKARANKFCDTFTTKYYCLPTNGATYSSERTCDTTKKYPYIEKRKNKRECNCNSDGTGCECCDDPDGDPQKPTVQQMIEGYEQYIGDSCDTNHITGYLEGDGEHGKHIPYENDASAVAAQAAEGTEGGRYCDESNCGLKYKTLKYAQCDSYSYCISYSVRTTNKFLEEYPFPIRDDAGNTYTPGPGEYVWYYKDTEDQLYNSKQYPQPKIEEYDATDNSWIMNYDGEAGTNIIRSGEFNSKNALTGYAYENKLEALWDLANDGADARTNPESFNGREVDDYDFSDRWLVSKYRLASDPGATALCLKSLTYTGISSEDLSYTTTPSVPGGNIKEDDAGFCDQCKSADCGVMIKDGDVQYAYTFGNISPLEWRNNGYAQSCDSDTSSDDGADVNIYCGTGDSCDTKIAEDTRKAFLDGMHIVDRLNEYSSAMVAANARIVKYSKEMFACQHFELYNASDGEDSQRKNNSLWASDFMGTRRSFVRIVSTFEPDISYTYDEEEYMTIVGPDNIMERFDELNNSVYDCYDMTTREKDDGNPNCYNDATNTKRDTEIKFYGNGGITSTATVELARNYTVNTYYDTKNTQWSTGGLAAISYGELDTEGANKKEFTCDGSDCNIGDSVNADLEPSEDEIPMYKRTLLCLIGKLSENPTLVRGGGDAKVAGSLMEVYFRDKDTAWTGGMCYVTQIQYLKANYIKASIENGSFYKNKGYWYIDNGNDTKAHGDNLPGALDNSNDLIGATYDSSDQEELARWSVLGSYNVFPIKMTTPRNMYTYTYTFSNIGSYGDGTIGRVMGNDQSLIAMNSRSCFYEVYEALCLCCGNEITTHIDEELTELIRAEYSYIPSDPPDENKPPTSYLAINTSTISLSDLQNDVNRTMGNNWSDESEFFYNGDVFTTKKGEDLLKYIENTSRAENAYSAEPEYSFSLTPAGLVKIREYNDSHKYGIDYYDLGSTGRFAITPYQPTNYLECEIGSLGSCKWEVEETTDSEDFPQNRIINFTHYESLFLKDEITQMDGVSFSGKYSDYENVKMKTDCYVFIGEDGSASIDSQLATKAETCRWVDYVLVAKPKTDEDGNAYTRNADVERYFRLAYK